jgi:hypothetical protein
VTDGGDGASAKGGSAHGGAVDGGGATPAFGTDTGMGVSSHVTAFGPGADTKSGFCPLPLLPPVGYCQSLCYRDAACPDAHKCCNSGCGFRCTIPLMRVPEPHVKPGRCPQVRSGEFNLSVDYKFLVEKVTLIVPNDCVS